MQALPQNFSPPNEGASGFSSATVQILERLVEGFLQLDAQWCLIYVNGYAEELLGRSRQELLGQMLGTLFPEDEDSSFTQEYQRAIATKRVVPFLVDYQPLQKRFEARLYPDELGISIYFQDVTARQQQAERLHLLEKAIAASNNGIVISDMSIPEQPLIYCNPAFEALTGYTQSEILGRNCRFLQGEDTEQAALEKIRQCIRWGEATRVTLKNYRKDGTFFWNELAISPVQDATGKITHYIGVQSDITARKQAQEALQKSEDRFQKLTANIPGAIYQFRLTSTGEKAFTYMSSGSKRVYDIDPEAVINQADLLLANIHPQDQFDFQASILHSASTLEPWQWEGRFIHSSGTVKWLQAASRPERQANGDILWDGVLMDISDRKEAESQLRQHIEMLDLASDTILIINLEGNIVYWNQGAQQLYGWTKYEAIGNNLHELLKTTFIQPLTEIKAICLAQGYWEGELIHTTQSGAKVIVASRWTLQRNERGEPTAILEINNDITERKQAENALRQSEQRERQKAQELEQAMNELKRTQTQLLQYEKMVSMGQLVAGVAHEINNPITFIACNLNYAERYVEDVLKLIQAYQLHYPYPGGVIDTIAEEIDIDFIKRDFPKLMRSMQSGAERISQIVLNLRNFSRLDEAEYKRVDIHEGLESTIELVHHRLQDELNLTAVQIVRDYQQIPLIECYASQLNQVFLHLLNNAIDALAEKQIKDLNYQPEIQIATKFPTPEFIEIWIKDNGVGIPEKLSKKIFDPFFTTKPVGKGAGLGLSISYQIVVDKHGGELRCNSQLNQGSTFVIKIPVQR